MGARDDRERELRDFRMRGCAGECPRCGQGLVYAAADSRGWCEPCCERERFECGGERLRLFDPPAAQLAGQLSIEAADGPQEGLL